MYLFIIKKLSKFLKLILKKLTNGSILKFKKNIFIIKSKLKITLDIKKKNTPLLYYFYIIQNYKKKKFSFLIKSDLEFQKNVNKLLNNPIFK